MHNYMGFAFAGIMGVTMYVEHKWPMVRLDNLFNVSVKKIGGIWFVKIGHRISMTICVQSVEAYERAVTAQCVKAVSRELRA